MRLYAFAYRETRGDVRLQLAGGTWLHSIAPGDQILRSQTFHQSRRGGVEADVVRRRDELVQINCNQFCIRVWHVGKTDPGADWKRRIARSRLHNHPGTLVTE